MPFAVLISWKDLEIIIIGQLNQTERQISCDVPYMWNLKMIQMNLFTKQKQGLPWWSSG